MTRLEILQDWQTRVWVQGDLSGLEDFLPPDGARSGAFADLEVRAVDLAELIPAFHAHLTELSFETLHHLETEEWLWALQRVRARHRASGRDVIFTGQIALRFDAQGIAEAFNHFDMIALFEAIGALPDQTAALCLSGEVLS